MIRWFSGYCPVNFFPFFFLFFLLFIYVFILSILPFHCAVTSVCIPQRLGIFSHFICMCRRCVYIMYEFIFNIPFFFFSNLSPFFVFLFPRVFQSSLFQRSVFLQFLINHPSSPFLVPPFPVSLFLVPVFLVSLVVRCNCLCSIVPYSSVPCSSIADWSFFCCSTSSPVPTFPLHCFQLQHSLFPHLFQISRLLCSSGPCLSISHFTTLNDRFSASSPLPAFSAPLFPVPALSIPLLTPGCRAWLGQVDEAGRQAGRQTLAERHY